MDRATEYAKQVVSGQVVAGLPHIQACQRHLTDIERSASPDFAYEWKPELSERVIDYANTLTIAEGVEPKPLTLLPFQHFDIGALFGWVRKDNGFRRYRRSYKSLARQNSKTFQNGIIGTYIAGFSGYKYGKLFTVATKRRQARLAWEEMSKFIEIDPDLSDLFKVQDYKSLITCEGTNCTIEALSREGGLDDGFRSIFSSIDEIHQMQDNSIYKALYNGTRSLPETLVSMITTRGKSLNGFCYEMDSYALSVLAGTSEADDFFVDIFTLDKDDDYFDESVWVKANPFLMTTDHGREIMRQDAKTARDMGGSDLSDFLTKCLNIWALETDNAYIDVEAWQDCGTDKTLENMRGQPCYVGLDLSSGGDLTTIGLDFPLPDGRDYFESHSFMPRGRFEEHIKTDLAPYDIWEKQELITITGGPSDFKNDYLFIIKYLDEIREQYDLKYLGIAYDPHNADALLSDLEEFGCPLMEIRQSARALNDATVAIQLGVKSRTIEYNRRNALLTWSMVNAKTVANSFGEIKVDKDPKARNRRIDPVDALIDAHTMKMKMPPVLDLNERILSDDWTL